MMEDNDGNFDAIKLSSLVTLPHKSQDTSPNSFSLVPIVFDFHADR